jgi:uncharacterized membrane protein
MQPVFTIKDALGFGWRKTMENIAFLIFLTLGFFIVSLALDKEGDGAVSAIFQIVNLFVSYFAMFTFVRIGLTVYRGGKPRAKEVFEFDWKTFGLYVAAAILTMIATAVGFVLLIIPGIILMVRFGFFAFALIDEGLGPVESIKRSLSLTKGRFWRLLGFSAVLAVINLAGALAFGVGLIVTAPLCLLATVYVYEKLKEASLPVAEAPVAPVPPTSAA